MKQKMEQNLNTSTHMHNLNLYWCLFLYIGLFTNFQRHYAIHPRGYYKLILL